MPFLVVWLVPRVARKHCLVQAPGPGLTIVFLTFLVLAQGGGLARALPGIDRDVPFRDLVGTGPELGQGGGAPRAPDLRFRKLRLGTFVPSVLVSA